jgi:hypothetical protein
MAVLILLDKYKMMLEELRDKFIRTVKLREFKILRDG